MVWMRERAIPPERTTNKLGTTYRHASIKASMGMSRLQVGENACEVAHHNSSRSIIFILPSTHPRTTHTPHSSTLRVTSLYPWRTPGQDPSNTGASVRIASFGPVATTAEPSSMGHPCGALAPRADKPG